MKKRKLFFIYTLFFCFSSYSQYYNSAQINTINTTKTANEGDLYLDTINQEYYIGLSNGILSQVGSKTDIYTDSMRFSNDTLVLYLTNGVRVKTRVAYNDDQNIDSLVFRGDTLSVFIENGMPAKVNLSSLRGGATVGDIKSGIQSTDHGGWFIMDGRSVLSIPLVARLNAATVGITTNLPNASNRVMKAKTGTESLMATGGAATHTLVQANLPNYNLPTTTSTSNGNHTHTGITDTSGSHFHSLNNNNISIIEKGFANSGSNRELTVIQDGTNNLVTDVGGRHQHNFTTNAGGAHTHSVTVNSGGSGTPFNLYQPYMVVNQFIYLGQ